MVDKEINLIDYYKIIRKRIWSIILIVVSITLITAAYSLFLPKVYRSSAVILPLGATSNGGGLAAMAAQFQSISSITNGVGGTASARLLAILQSRTLAENLINRYDLLKVLFKNEWDPVKNQWKSGQTPSMEAAVGIIQSMTGFSDDKKTGIITIHVSAEDPKFVKDMVDHVLIELQNFISVKELSEAKRNRVFVEGRLAVSKKEFLSSGKELAQFYQINKISPVSTSVDIPIEDISMDHNPNLIQTDPSYISDHVSDLNQQKEVLDQALSHVSVVHDVPQQVYLEYLTQKRQILTSLVGLLSQQYEMARMDEAREDISFQVIDEARVPERRFKPQRKKIVMTAFMFSFFVALFYVFIREYFDKIRSLIR